MTHYQKRPRPINLDKLGSDQAEKITHINDWLISSARGSRITYYVGDLGGDKEDFACKVRDLMWAAMENGVVYLFQRRTSKVGLFEYLAIKRHERYETQNNA